MNYSWIKTKSGERWRKKHRISIEDCNWMCFKSWAFTNKKLWLVWTTGSCNQWTNPWQRKWTRKHRPKWEMSRITSSTSLKSMNLEEQSTLVCRSLTSKKPRLKQLRFLKQLRGNSNKSRNHSKKLLKSKNKSFDRRPYVNKIKAKATNRSLESYRRNL